METAVIEREANVLFSIKMIPSNGQHTFQAPTVISIVKTAQKQYKIIQII